MSLLPHTRWLLSFDIDGTLEIGDPPGPVLLALVRAARSRGHVVGSSSDRTLAEQRALWAAAGIDVDFVNRKHELALVRQQFDCARFLHVGDTETDRWYATRADFEFFVAGAALNDELLSPRLARNSG